MTKSDVAFDSNVILYLVSGDSAKAGTAERLMRQGGVVSVQVMNEVVSVARRKFQMPWREVHDLLAAVKATCELIGVTLVAHRLGIQIAQRHGYQIYDSVIISAALLGGCRVLYSEDMHDGQQIGRITIRNPFAPHSLVQ